MTEYEALLINRYDSQVTDDFAAAIIAAGLADAAEVPLAGLPAGRYSLRVTVNDRAAKSTAAQRISFMVK